MQHLFPYVILEGAFRKKMKFIFNNLWSNVNKLLFLLGLKGKFMINVMILLFEIVHFPFSDGDIPRSKSYGVYISQLIQFARVSSLVAGFYTHNKLLTEKFL